MTPPSRKTLRTGVTALLKSMSVGTLGAILADETVTSGTPPVTVVTQIHAFTYFVKDPGGISPFACVDSGSIFYNLNSNDGVPTKATLVIGFWSKRDDDDRADDELDDLAQALATMLQLNYNARFATQSVTDNEVLAGIPYKFELHFVEFDI